MWGLHIFYHFHCNIRFDPWPSRFDFIADNNDIYGVIENGIRKLILYTTLYYNGWPPSRQIDSYSAARWLPGDSDPVKRESLPGVYKSPTSLSF